MSNHSYNTEKCDYDENSDASKNTENYCPIDYDFNDKNSVKDQNADLIDRNIMYKNSLDSGIKIPINKSTSNSFKLLSSDNSANYLNDSNINYSDINTTTLQFFDKNNNFNSINKIYIPLEYFDKNFIHFYTNYDNKKNTKIYLCLAHIFYKNFSNSEFKVYYQVEGKEEDFHSKCKHYYLKYIKEVYQADNFEKKQHIMNNKIDIECNYESDCLNNDSSISYYNLIEVYINNTLVELNIDDYVEIDSNTKDKSKKKSNSETKIASSCKQSKDKEKHICTINSLFKSEEKQSNKYEAIFGNFDTVMNLTIPNYSSVSTRKSNNKYSKVDEFNKQVILRSDFHKYIYELISKNKDLPFDNNDNNKNNSFKGHIIIFELQKICFNTGTRFSSEKIGIINEAMTCYMNSMLQTLNSLSYFKKAIFKVPDEKKESCIYGLQRLFYDLETSKKPVTTSHLIESFGWSGDEVMVQHDIQEFNLLLSDSLEKKMKGTEADGIFKYLFEGKILNYIRCINVNYKSEREETYSDIQLNVKGNKNIYEALDSYVIPEILEKDNQYQSDSFGKQDAEKGVKFVKLPPVIIFQLKRFEYNMYIDMFEKVNDRFEFYNSLDMSKYINEETYQYNMDERDKNISYISEYSLHSVVIHSGNINYGHYYCYIKNNSNSCENDLNWTKFNDETVKKCTEFEAIELNYGGKSQNFAVKESGEIVEKEIQNECSAYILVYIRNSEKEKLLDSFNTKIDIPNVIEKYIKDSIKTEKEILFNSFISSKNTDIYLADNRILSNYKGFGIAPSYYDNNKQESLFLNINNFYNFKFPSNLTIYNLLEFISEKTNIPSEFLHLVKYEYLSFKDPRKKNFFKGEYVHYLEDEIKALTGSKKKKYFLIVYCSLLNNLDLFYNTKSDNDNSICNLNNLQKKFNVKQVIDINIFKNCSNNDSENKLNLDIHNDINKEHYIYNKTNESCYNKTIDYYSNDLLYEKVSASNYSEVSEIRMDFYNNFQEKCNNNKKMDNYKNPILSNSIKINNTNSKSKSSKSKKNDKKENKKEEFNSTIIIPIFKNYDFIYYNTEFITSCYEHNIQSQNVDNYDLYNYSLIKLKYFDINFKDYLNKDYSNKKTINNKLYSDIIFKTKSFKQFYDKFFNNIENINNPYSLKSHHCPHSINNIYNVANLNNPLIKDLNIINKFCERGLKDLEIAETYKIFIIKFPNIDIMHPLIKMLNSDNIINEANNKKSIDELSISNIMIDTSFYSQYIVNTTNEDNFKLKSKQLFNYVEESAKNYYNFLNNASFKKYFEYHIEYYFEVLTSEFELNSNDSGIRYISRESIEYYIKNNSLSFLNKYVYTTNYTITPNFALTNLVNSIKNNSLNEILNSNNNYKSIKINNSNKININSNTISISSKDMFKEFSFKDSDYLILIPIVNIEFKSCMYKELEILNNNKDIELFKYVEKAYNSLLLDNLKQYYENLFNSVYLKLNTIIKRSISQIPFYKFKFDYRENEQDVCKRIYKYINYLYNKSDIHKNYLDKNNNKSQLSCIKCNIHINNPVNYCNTDLNKSVQIIKNSYKNETISNEIIYNNFTNKLNFNSNNQSESVKSDISNFPSSKNIEDNTSTKYNNLDLLNNISNFYSQNKENVYIYYSNNLMSLNYFMKNFLSEEYIKLIYDQNRNISERIPILSDFIFDKTCLNFKIKFYKYKINNNNYTRDMPIHDIDNNPIAYLHSVIPNKITTVEEYSKHFKFLFSYLNIIKLVCNSDSVDPKNSNTLILNHLDYNICNECSKITVSKLFNNQYSNLVTSTNLCCILQEVNGTIAYEILFKPNDNLYRKMKENTSYIFLFRFQPYSNSHIKQFFNIENDSYNKVYLAFRTKDKQFVCDPIVISIDKAIKVADLKDNLYCILKKIKALDNYEVSDLKLYTFNYFDSVINKDRLLIESRNDSAVSAYFNKRAWNILVELPPKSKDYKEGDLLIN